MRVAACMVASVLVLAGCGGSEDKAAPSGAGSTEKTTITFYTDAIGKQREISEAMAKEFEAAENIRVEFVAGPNDATERLAEMQKFLAARSPDYDVLMIDVIWPGMLKRHLQDLSQTIAAKDHFPAIIENNTVGGKLLAVPFYADAGLLYYRTDLLEANGFKAPPKTWDELTEMATKIQAAEREKGNARFFGYVFQGASYEGLTCNAVEWQGSAGLPFAVTSENTVTLMNPQLMSLFDTRRAWVGTISPRSILTAKEEDARLLFQGGNAAFMRNWPYAYSLAQADDSPVKDKVGVTTLPSGGAKPAAVLGGWQLAVSNYTDAPDAARKWVAFLSTKEAQRRRALEGGYFATRPDVYGDEEITEVVPYFDEMRAVFEGAVARPSTAAGEKYNELSGIYYQTVHAILSGSRPAPEALAEGERRMNELLKRE